MVAAVDAAARACCRPHSARSLYIRPGRGPMGTVSGTSACQGCARFVRRWAVEPHDESVGAVDTPQPTSAVGAAGLETGASREGADHTVLFGRSCWWSQRGRKTPSIARDQVVRAGPRTRVELLKQ